MDTDMDILWAYSMTARTCKFRTGSQFNHKLFFFYLLNIQTLPSPSAEPTTAMPESASSQRLYANIGKSVRVVNALYYDTESV